MDSKGPPSLHPALTPAALRLADGPTFATPSSFGDAMTAACAAVALVDVIASATTLDSAGHSGSSGGRGEAGPEHQEEQQQQQGAGQPPGAALSPPVGFSLCRPPGHHATPGDQMGFCLLNNAALAARHAQRAHGLRKVRKRPVGRATRPCPRLGN